MGQELTGNYNYTDSEGDAEGDSLYAWYRGDNFDGSDKQAILAATSKEYTLTENDRGKYIFFEVTPIAQSGERVGTAVESVAAPIEVPGPEMLATTRIANGIGNVLGRAEVGDQIIIDYNKPMDVDQIGELFNISFLHSSPTLIRVDSKKIGQFAEIRTNGQIYTMNPGTSDYAYMNFNDSAGVWSENHKTLTITLANQSGDATQSTSIRGLGTLTLYSDTSAVAADGTKSVQSELTTTAESSF
ncbi:hypothetical protein DV702_16585 [Sporosarcina sp. PTS2304]|uniref:hypothetical protein n=1 Tax=Sporosarcina sp. PTS2304 TaxID=2283194 RepID=UPI000E0D3D8C|nr:hypothetical protein [Sporosarcina sp. PTS2304]AXI01195.1 hypothetical protein DV702_16585 [Sporosarcina sp. PTS2304]